jgi:CRISPR system Cascade subunit CasB
VTIAPYCQYLTEEQAKQLRRWHQSMNAAPSELQEQNIMPAPSGQRARLCRSENLPALLMTDGFRRLWFAINPPEQNDNGDASCLPDDGKSAVKSVLSERVQHTPSPTKRNYLNNHFAMLAWACVAGVLADVRTDVTPRAKTKAPAKGKSRSEENIDYRSLAAMAGSPAKNSDRSQLSELRFQRLQTAESEEELLLLLRRLVKQLDRKAPLARLADDILCWFAEYHDRVPRDVEKRIALKWATEYYRAASSHSK